MGGGGTGNSNPRCKKTITGWWGKVEKWELGGEEIQTTDVYGGRRGNVV